MLAMAIPGERQIIGIDLAEGMVDAANARIGASSDPLLRQAALPSKSMARTHACLTAPKFKPCKCTWTALSTV